MGPPCSSYVWVNRASSGRGPETPYGYEEKRYVNEATQILAKINLLWSTSGN
jgi:hypothetical protein